jgi:hypothetical protein
MTKKQATQETAPPAVPPLGGGGGISVLHGTRTLSCDLFAEVEVDELSIEMDDDDDDDDDASSPRFEPRLVMKKNKILKRSKNLSRRKHFVSTFPNSLWSWPSSWQVPRLVLPLTR